MAKISEQSIEQIRNRADIIDIISSYVELKKRGRNFFGLCPFHNEKTASFSVSPEKQIYKCFGCGAGGSSIDFIILAFICLVSIFSFLKTLVLTIVESF